MLFRIPHALADRFRSSIPGWECFVAKLIEQPLPEEDDSLYQVALAVEQDSTLNAEMCEWREGLLANGIRDAHSTEDPVTSR